MKTSDFSYSLPDQVIAKIPIEPRDEAKLLVSRQKDELIDSQIKDLCTFVEPGDVIVVNDTKVLPARIHIKREGGGKGEIFLLNRIDSGLWNALVKPSAKINVNEKVYCEAEQNEIFEFEIGENSGEGHRIVKFLNVSELEVLDKVGQTPLPPYLGDVDIPLDRYQTIFAKEDKSVAAPTAGLHFTDNLVNNLSKHGVKILEVTLHVGVGTFRPIVTEDVESHVMHEELYNVDQNVFDEVIKAKKAGNKVIAVGTTSMRTIESVALTSQFFGKTKLYCYGDFDFKIVDMLLTNFHQPQSSLLVLLDSFIGSRWRNLYNYALENEYRFLSFGDAMLVGWKSKGHE